MSRFKPALAFVLSCVLLWAQTVLAVTPLASANAPKCNCCHRMDCCSAPSAPSAPVPVAPSRTEAGAPVATPQPLPQSFSVSVFPDADAIVFSTTRAATALPLPASPIYERTCSYLI
ncbi:MAG TPA: hypothetical protein VK968_00215 [Roseimicrobium sp.]|nr:hypothetical protein [Roseimicrobium sp.]